MYTHICNIQYYNNNTGNVSDINKNNITNIVTNNIIKCIIDSNTTSNNTTNNTKSTYNNMSKTMIKNKKKNTNNTTMLIQMQVQLTRTARKAISSYMMTLLRTMTATAKKITPHSISMTPYKHGNSNDINNIIRYKWITYRASRTTKNDNINDTKSIKKTHSDINNKNIDNIDITNNDKNINITYSNTI